MAVRLLEPRARYGAPAAETPMEVLEYPGLSALAKLTYTALASFAWHSDECWPSQKALAERASLSIRQVRRCLEELQSAALIECTPHEGSTPARYRLLPVQEAAPARTLKPKKQEYETGQPEGDCESAWTEGRGLTVRSMRTHSPVLLIRKKRTTK
jgi:DNA-binding transcriptional MocR family regulator